MRVPQPSKLRAKVDVYFRTIDNPEGDQILLEDLPVSSVEIVRNGPGVADTASVDYLGDAFPFDLRIVADKSMFVSVWLYEQDHPAFVWGAGNHFFGVVDDFKRDRYTLAGSLECRDMTAVPLQATMPEGMIRKFAVEPGATVEAVVSALLREIPGAAKWAVISLAPAAKGAVVPLVPRPPKKGAAEKPTTLAALVPPEEVTVWGAITNVCARAGIVPEVRMDKDGEPAVLLVDGADLQTSSVLRPFSRDGRNWRLFLDGDGIAELSETLALSDSDDRPGAVECTSSDGISARWPETTTKGARDEKVLLQHIPGVATVADLQALARAGFEALCRNQYRVSLGVVEPWSEGGGPHHADLLDLAYGAAVEIQSRGFDAIAAGRSAEEILTDRGLTPAAATLITRAQERIGALSLLFQCAEVRHSWRAGGYRCEMNLRQFLGTADAPVISADAGSRAAANRLVTP